MEIQVTTNGTRSIDGVLQVIDVTYKRRFELENDTGFTFNDDDFFSGIGNGTGTDYATWGAGWTRQ